MNGKWGIVTCKKVGRRDGGGLTPTGIIDVELVAQPTCSRSAFCHKAAPTCKACKVIEYGKEREVSVGFMLEEREQ